VTTDSTRVFARTTTTIALADGPLALAVVDDLEAHVDRVTLLAGEDPAEPPYWAHLWSGARVLADAVPRGRGRAVEVGCGLGLPGLAALRRGWRTTFVDREVAPLAFVAASAAANALPTPARVAADFTTSALRPAAFDLVLAAELLYDRAAFATIAASLARLLAPRGALLLADAARIDTSTFWPLLERSGLHLTITQHRLLEEGFPVTISLITATRW
jgi:predicted nicotinamide N-methyase